MEPKRSNRKLVTTMLQINKDYALGDYEGDTRIAQNLYVVLHESGNQNDIYDNQAVLHEVQYMRNHYDNAYSTFFVGGGGQIFQIGEPGYVAWACLGGNPYSPVQIELARTADTNIFKKDYEAYIELARTYAQKYGIPLTLDAGSAGTAGIKSHQWITNNYGGDHVDPYDYLASHGITKKQLAYDLVHGISTVEPITICNVVQAYSPNGGALTMYHANGQAFDNTPLINQTKWVSNGIVPDKFNRPMFLVGNDSYLPQRSTTLNQIVEINQKYGQCATAVTAEGKIISGLGNKFKAQSRWKTADKLFNIKSIGWCYQVSTKEFIPIKYQVGSGFKG